PDWGVPAAGLPLSLRATSWCRSLEGAAQQRDRLGSFIREILGRRFDADTLVVSDLAKVRKERRVVVLVPSEREDAALRVGHVQMTDVCSGPHDDLRVFLFAGQMIEVHHELKVGIVDGPDQLE